MSARKTTLSERNHAVELCRRIMSGAERVPTRAIERDYLADCLAGASVALRWLEANGEDARAYVELRRRARAAGAGEAVGTQVAAVEPPADPAPRCAGDAEEAAAGKSRRRITEMACGAWAALRGKDVAFRRFLSAADEEDAARLVRAQCGVASRGELDRNAEAAERWRALDARVRAWMDCVGEDGAE